MKILHTLSQLPDATGSGIYLQAMLREAANNGHQNFVVAATFTQAQIPSLITDNDHRLIHFGAGDLPHKIVGMSDVMPYPSKRFRDLSESEIDDYLRCFHREIKKAIDDFAPDLIHSHHLWLMTAMIRKNFALPIVASCHGSDLRQLRNCPHLKELVVPQCTRLQAIMALSRTQKREIAELYQIAEEKVEVVGAGYNDQLFSPEEKPPPPPVRLVYAGKLSRAKGVLWMLKAMARLDYPHWKLHLAGGGSGQEREEIIQLAGDFGNKVEICGLLTQNELAGLMQQAHIFVLPSFFEGLPLVLLEALACGCRLVTTSLPGVKEIFAQKTQDIEIVPLPQLQNVDEIQQADEEKFVIALVQALTKQIQLLLRTPAIAEQTTAILNRYSWQQVFTRVENTYQKICK